MHWLGWIVVVLAVSTGGWMVFDGLHALATGDYVTPSSGEYAGQLGPWSGLVERIGIQPRSDLMKAIFVGLGSVWLVFTAAFVRGRRWGRVGLLACAIGSLWYVAIGTGFCVVQIALLLAPPVRRGRARS